MKLSKKGIVFNTLQTFGAVFVFLAFINPMVGVVLFLPLLAIAGGYQYLYWKNYNFYFDDGDLKIESGVITKNKLDIPIRRIQDIDVKRGIFQRIFSIAQVNIKTAGGDVSKASLKYLDEQQAEEVRQKLRDLKNRREKDSEQNDQSTNNESEPEKFYEIGDSLMTYSLLTGAPGAILLAAFFTLVAIGASGFFATSAVEMTLYSTGLVIAAIVLSGLMYLAGAASKYIQYYDFHVDRRRDVFEYERGMINKEGGSLPEEKIQKLEVTENFLMRYLGYATLKAETAGVMDTEEVSGTSTKVLIPLDSKEEVYRHAREIGELEIDNIENIGPIAKKRYYRRYLLLSTILLAGSTALIVAGLHPGITVIPIIGFLISGKASGLKWSNIGYSMGENNLMVMKGFWNRKTYAVPYFRVQNLVTSESVFQRRWELATVTVDTAGSRITNPQIVDLEKEQAYRNRDRLFEKFKDSIY